MLSRCHFPWPQLSLPLCLPGHTSPTDAEDRICNNHPGAEFDDPDIPEQDDDELPDQTALFMDEIARLMDEIAKLNADGPNR